MGHIHILHYFQDHKIPNTQAHTSTTKSNYLLLIFNIIYNEATTRIFCFLDLFSLLSCTVTLLSPYAIVHAKLIHLSCFIPHLASQFPSLGYLINHSPLFPPPFGVTATPKEFKIVNNSKFLSIHLHTTQYLQFPFHLHPITHVSFLL